MKPLVSIIIPVYNGSNYMSEAIDSALSQTYKNIEVLVINDGSADNGETEKIALSYGEKIRYFSKPNGGVASALNLGICEMRGEYFSWLSHDDIYYPNKIKEQINMLSNCGDSKTVIFSGWDIIDDKSKLINSVVPTERYTGDQLKNPLFPLLHGMISGCCLLIHKSHFECAGLFDETLPMTQDFDLWFRILRDNAVICYPGVLTMTRVHENQGSKKSISKFSEEGDNFWIYMLQSISKEEMISMEGCEYKFFKSIYIYLFLYSTYEKSIGYTKKRLYEALNDENLNIFKYLKERLSVLGLGQKAAVKELLSSFRKAGLRNTFKRARYAILRIIKR